MYKSLHPEIDPASMAGSCCVDPLAARARGVPCLVRVWRQQNAMVPACRERSESGVLMYVHMGLPHPERVWNSSVAVHAHRAAPSRESTELGECCKAHMQSTRAQTWLKQQGTLCAHWILLLRSKRTRKHTQTRLPHSEPTPSGQATHYAPHMPAQTTTSLPKPSDTQSTERQLFQNWKRQLFHLTHRNKHRTSDKMGRRTNKPQ